ncbi:uncharacterized protein LOC144133242 [Amblyomma americanum]
MLWFRRMLPKMVGILWLLVLGGCSVHAGCPHCTTLRSLGPPPSAIVDMPPPPRLPSFPSWTGPACGGNRSHSSLCHHAHHHAGMFNASIESTGWWLMGPSPGGEGDKAWPLAVVLVAGSATVLGSVVLLVLSKKKRWQPGRSSPGHTGLPAALLPSKGILVGASLPAAGGAYDNSAFAENVAVMGGGQRASLLRQLQPPSLGGYRQLPPHQGPPQ